MLQGKKKFFSWQTIICFVVLQFETYIDNVSSTCNPNLVIPTLFMEFWFVPMFASQGLLHERKHNEHAQILEITSYWYL
jgi:hypothetical protein